MGVAVPDTGYSVPKLISGFHTSSVHLNICVRKETGREECKEKELSARTQRMTELISWLGRFYSLPYLSFPNRFLPVSLPIVSVQSSH